MKYYRVNDRGDMFPYHIYNGRSKKWMGRGFLLKGQLLTPSEYQKMGVFNYHVDEIEIKKSSVKYYEDGTRYEK